MTLGFLSSCAAAPLHLPPPPVHADGQVLWHIVNDSCVPSQLRSGDPSPCTSVSITAGRDRGYVVLKDRVGTGQYLVMPTILVSGIEDPLLTRPGAPDYFTPAWGARRLVAARFGRALAREDIGIAVNSRYGRSQDLLHLHVDCLRRDVRDALRRDMTDIGTIWSRRPMALAAHRYYVIWVDGDETVEANPFALLAKRLHVRPADMGAWTILLSGAHFSGKPGFILLAAHADPATSDNGSAEILLDHDCMR